MGRRSTMIGSTAEQPTFPGQTRRQAPEWRQCLLGRLTASRRFIVWGTIPLGALVGGVLATTIGLRPTLWVGAVGSCSCFVPVLLSPPAVSFETCPPSQSSIHWRLCIRQFLCPIGVDA